jgi:hypothetical protein
MYITIKVWPFGRLFALAYVILWNEKLAIYLGSVYLSRRRSLNGKVSEKMGKGERSVL